MLKIGVVPYLNALPLTHSLRGPLIYGTPAELELMIQRGDLDLALLPVFSLFKNTSLIPYLSCGVIQSHGPVESVCLFYEPSLKNLDNLQVWFSPESVTSVALFKVLAKFYWKIKFQEIVHPHQAKAQLIIGDKALFFEQTKLKRLDLGQAWFKFCQLPFVYATWVANQTLSESVQQELLAANQAGQTHLGKIIETIGRDYPKKIVEHYLRHCIQYQASPASQAGLQHFQKTCVEAGLIPSFFMNSPPCLSSEALAKEAGRGCGEGE